MNSRRFAISSLTLSVLLVLSFGCEREPVAVEDPETNPTSVAEPTAEEPVVEVATEDAEAIAALEEKGAALKRDGAGRVIEVDFRGAEIVDADLEPLAKFPALRSVLLTGTGVTDEGLKTLGQIETLQNLDLRETTIGNAGLEHLAGLSRLRALRLSGKDNKTTVDDEGLAALAGLTSLEVLAFDHLWVSEVGLNELKGLANLRELYLAQTLLGDEGAAALTQFPKL
jgi:hypothetical protein